MKKILVAFLLATSVSSSVISLENASVVDTITAGINKAYTYAKPSIDYVYTKAYENPKITAATVITFVSWVAWRSYWRSFKTVEERNAFRKEHPFLRLFTGAMETKL